MNHEHVMEILKLGHMSFDFTREIQHGHSEIQGSYVVRESSRHSPATAHCTQTYCHALNWYEARGGVVVKALRYKPAGRGFDSRWCHWNFSVT
jgi:hypothetical protein